MVYLPSYFLSRCAILAGNPRYSQTHPWMKHHCNTNEQHWDLTKGEGQIKQTGARGLSPGQQAVNGRTAPSQRGLVTPDTGCVEKHAILQGSDKITVHYKHESQVKRALYAGYIQLYKTIHYVSVVTEMKGKSKLHQKA